MRYLIDNYICASDSQKIGSMDDFTLLDFIITQEDRFTETYEKLKKNRKSEKPSKIKGLKASGGI